MLHLVNLTVTCSNLRFIGDQLFPIIQKKTFTQKTPSSQTSSKKDSPGLATNPKVLAAIMEWVNTPTTPGGAQIISMR